MNERGATASFNLELGDVHMHIIILSRSLHFRIDIHNSIARESTARADQENASIHKVRFGFVSTSPSRDRVLCEARVTVDRSITKYTMLA